MNRSLLKSLIISCWIGIAAIGIIYIAASLVPNQYTFNVGQERIQIPKIDPLIYLNTKYYALPQKIYNLSNPEVSPNQFLIDKANNFYSGAGTEYYVKVFYRPDFERFPRETILILLFRLSTFISIVLILYFLSKVFSSFLTNDAFDILNKERFLWMGLLLFLISIIRVLHSTVLSSFLKYNPRLLGYEVEPSFQPLWLIIVGGIVIIFSFVYGHLISLHEEQKLTV